MKLGQSTGSSVILNKSAQSVSKIAELFLSLRHGIAKMKLSIYACNADRLFWHPFQPKYYPCFPLDTIKIHGIGDVAGGYIFFLLNIALHIFHHLFVISNSQTFFFKENKLDGIHPWIFFPLIHFYPSKYTIEFMDS